MNYLILHIRGFMIPHFMVNTAHKMTSPIIQEIEHNAKHSYSSEFTQKLSLGKLQTLLGMRGNEAISTYWVFQRYVLVHLEPYEEMK